MQAKNKSILKVLKLEGLPIEIFQQTVISASKKMMEKEGMVPPVLIVVGKKNDDHIRYCYNFNLVSHPDVNSSPISSDDNTIISSIMRDVREEFESIELVIFQTLASMLIGDASNEEKLKSAFASGDTDAVKNNMSMGVVMYMETPTKKEKEVIFKLGKHIYLASQFNKDILKVEGNEQNFGVYNNKQTMEDIKVKKQTLWETLGVEKEYFDFMDEILKESKSEKIGLSDTIKKVIIKLRDVELGGGTSTGKKISPYEMKLFLAGKIFEEKLKKFTS